jgi:hypothetical protein
MSDMSKVHAYLLDVAEFDRQVSRYGYDNTSRFARESGVPRSTLMEYRSHATCPSLTNVGKIMDMFPGLPIEALFRRNANVAGGNPIRVAA